MIARPLAPEHYPTNHQHYADGSLRLICSNILRQAHRIFQYTADKEKYGKREYWAALEEINTNISSNGGVLQDDCDGFATYCRGQLAQANVASRYVYCHDENGGGHLVVLAGQRFVLDNRHKLIQSWELLPYYWISCSGFKPGEPWGELNIQGPIKTKGTIP